MPGMTASLRLHEAAVSQYRGNAGHPEDEARAAAASVDQIATEVGHAEGVTLRALLRRKLGRGVREVRGSA